VTLVDPDTYESRNLWIQDITPGAIGRSKAWVQARRLQRINPQLRVEAIALAVEDVPLGRLRCDLILACLDSRRARQTVNEVAWRLGIPWIDAGVLGAQMLARVNVYEPAPDNPCLECAWSQADYEAIEQEYPCAGGSSSARPSDSPSALGALAASLLAIECQKLLAGDAGCAAKGSQVTIDARWQQLHATSFRRHAGCRFDHRRWEIAPLVCRLSEFTLGQALDLGGELRVMGQRFVGALVCPGCGRREERFRLRLNRPASRCRGCGRRLAPLDFALDQLDSRLPAEIRGFTLAQAGILGGDVLSVNGKHYEIVPEAA
jgi:molybdopterin/thiamine biosynthesis adenylyltransferase